jgi:hypothetical protein
VLRVHQVEQCAHGALRGAFVGPNDDLRCEHVHPAQLGNPRRGDPVTALDHEMIYTTQFSQWYEAASAVGALRGPQQYTVNPSATTSSSSFSTTGGRSVT